MVSRILHLVRFQAVVWLLLLVGCRTGTRLPGGMQALRHETLRAADTREIDVAAWLSFYHWKYLFEGPPAARSFLPDSQALHPPIWNLIRRQSTELNAFLSDQTGQAIGHFPTRCDEAARADPQVVKSDLSWPECPYYHFPITGVNYRQVQEFCRWRTAMAGDETLEFRLPSESEWERLAVQGLKPSAKNKGFPDSLYKNGCPGFQYGFQTKCPFRQTEGGFLPYAAIQGTGRFWKDACGLYDMFGNVSEMVLEEGRAKGGNFRLPARSCHMDSIQFYRKGENWLGFRCVLVPKKN